MALTLRTTKGSPLTAAEMDANLTYLESQIQQGEQIVNKRSVTNLSEKSYIKYHQTPLLPAVQQRINNPSNQIESIASDGWIRGGSATREQSKQSHLPNDSGY
jgi:hypothetical protein